LGGGISGIIVVLPVNLNLGRKGQCEILPSSLDQALVRLGRAGFGNNSQSLPASASFSRIPSIGCGVSGVSQWILSWSQETVEEEK